MSLPILEDYRDRLTKKVAKAKEKLGSDFDFVTTVGDVEGKFPGFLELINAEAKLSAVKECIQESQKP